MVGGGVLRAKQFNGLVDWPKSHDEIEKEVDVFLSPNFRHHEFKSEDVMSDEVLKYWAGGVYTSLSDLFRGGNSFSARKDLDCLSNNLDSVLPLLSEVKYNYDLNIVDLAIKFFSDYYYLAKKYIKCCISVNG